MTLLHSIFVIVLSVALVACSPSPYEKAEEAFAEENWASAIVLYDAILAKKPEHTRALRKSAYALYRVERYDDAQARLIESIKYSDHFDAHLLLGFIDARRDDAQAAFKQWEFYWNAILESTGADSKQVILARFLKSAQEKLARQETTLKEILTRAESLAR